MLENTPPWPESIYTWQETSRDVLQRRTASSAQLGRTPSHGGCSNSSYNQLPAWNSGGGSAPHVGFNESPQFELVRSTSTSSYEKAWQGHAMRAARKSIDSHAQRIAKARGYRGREIPGGWGKRWFGPSTEVDKQPRDWTGDQPGAPAVVPVKERAVAAKPAIFGRSGDRFA